MKAAKPMLTKGDVIADEETGRRLWLGFQLRQLRVGKKLSLKQLSERASLSIAMLSQIELGKSTPSIRSLRQLAEALDVEPGFFVNGGSVPPKEEIGRIFRHDSFRSLHVGSGVTKKILTPPKGDLELVVVTIDPGGSSGVEPYTHKGEDAGYVLSGVLDLFVEGHKYVLRDGEAFRFKSMLPHRFANSSRKPTQVLWVATPPFY